MWLGGLPKGSQSDIQGQEHPKNIGLLGGQSVPSVITLNKILQLPYSRGGSNSYIHGLHVFLYAPGSLEQEFTL